MQPVKVLAHLRPALKTPATGRTPAPPFCIQSCCSSCRSALILSAPSISLNSMRRSRTLTGLQGTNQRGPQRILLASTEFMVQSFGKWHVAPKCNAKNQRRIRYVSAPQGNEAVLKARLPATREEQYASSGCFAIVAQGPLHGLCISSGKGMKLQRARHRMNEGRKR